MFSGGSIDSQWYVPRFAVDEGAVDRIHRAFDAVGVGFDFVRSTAPNCTTDYRPVEDAAVLGPGVNHEIRRR